MNETVDALLRDLLEWVAADERSYGQVMEAWRTSCPRLPVWEEAGDRGLVAQIRREGVTLVTLTPAGRAYLAGGSRA